MNSDSWTCLMVGKGLSYIDEDVRNTLKAGGCDMYLRKVDKLSFSNDFCAGTIQTSWDTQMVGIRSGVFFEAVITTDSGDCQVNFLINTKDLERGAETLRKIAEGNDGEWAALEGVPPSILSQFRDMRRLN